MGTGGSVSGKKAAPIYRHGLSVGEDFLAGEENLVKYDIVFLDISMKDIDGIETAMRIRSFHSGTCIVFVTAFLDYALDGYKADAVRYLMKDSLGTEMEECMAAVLERMELRQVAFPFTGGVQELYTDNILYVESRKHKSVFFCLESERKEYQLYEKLDVIEEKLGQYAFLRIHKSYLVNMKHIRKISSYAVILDTGRASPCPALNSGLSGRRLPLTKEHGDGDTYQGNRIVTDSCHELPYIL